MGVPKPWTAAALAILEDGRWHAREQLLAAGAAAVPPGVAFRYGEADRNRSAKRPNGPGPRLRGDDQTSVVTGARRMTERNLLKLVDRGRLERALIDGVDCLRLARANSRSRAS